MKLAFNDVICYPERTCTSSPHQSRDTRSFVWYKYKDNVTKNINYIINFSADNYLTNVKI